MAQPPFGLILLYLLVFIPIQMSQGARATVIAKMGEKHARVANACQAVEETRIARKRRIAKMALVSTSAILSMPVELMPCARAPNTRKSALVLQIFLETLRLSAFLTRKVREGWLTHSYKSSCRSL